MTDTELKSCIGTIEMLRRLHGVMNVIDAGNCEKIIKVLSDMKMCEEEQEPKTGNWIKYSIPRCGEQHYKCTSCGYYINFGQWGEVYTKEFKFCPNCGARMEEQ